MHIRPSHKELTKKLNTARSLADCANYFFVDPGKVAPDLAELNLFSTDEIKCGVSSALREATARDYKGKHPPERAFEHLVLGKELFEFAWRSDHFNQKIYLKFCLPDSNDEPKLAVLSLHVDRPNRRA